MTNTPQKEQRIEDLWDSEPPYARNRESDLQTKPDRRHDLYRNIVVGGTNTHPSLQRTSETDSGKKMFFHENAASTKKKTHHKTEGRKRYTAIFSAGNSQHIDLFLPLQEYMKNFDILYLISARWGKGKKDLESYVRSLNIQHIFLDMVSTDSEIKSILMQVNPDIVILGHDTNHNDYTIVKCSNYLGIPTLLVQDGIYPNSEYYQGVKKSILTKISGIPKLLLDHDYNVHEKIEIILYGIKVLTQPKPLVGRGNYTRIAVFGEATKQLLEQEGVDPRKIIVTGSPKFDYFYFQNCSNKYPIYNELKISPISNKILLITQPFVELGVWTQSQRKEYISQICTATEKFENCQLILKIRKSSEDIQKYREFTKFFKVNPIIYDDINLSELIKTADLVITVSSTGGLEAIAAEKPLIVFDPFQTPIPLYNSESVLHLDSADDLLVTIDRLLSDDLFRESSIQKQSSFLEENICRSDCKAAEKIYNIIMELVKQEWL